MFCCQMMIHNLYCQCTLNCNSKSLDLDSIWISEHKWFHSPYNEPVMSSTKLPIYSMSCMCVWVGDRTVSLTASWMNPNFHILTVERKGHRPFGRRDYFDRGQWYSEKGTDNIQLSFVSLSPNKIKSLKRKQFSLRKGQMHWVCVPNVKRKSQCHVDLDNYDNIIYVPIGSNNVIALSSDNIISVLSKQFSWSDWPLRGPETPVPYLYTTYRTQWFIIIIN